MIYFVTYADNVYANSRKRIKEEAEIFRLFDYINVYSREDIDPFFIEKTNPYILNGRGGGYWLWKPFFIKKTLDKMNYGDYCVYTDAGCTINNKGQERFLEYLKLIDNDNGILSFKMIHTEEKYNTEKLFNFLKIEENSEIRKSGQIMATILIIKKCDHSIKLIDEWYNIALNNPDLFSDIHNHSNIHSFIDHRHDQSVLSILRKKYGSIEIEDETWAPTPEEWQKLTNETKIPFLATRFR